MGRPFELSHWFIRLAFFLTGTLLSQPADSCAVFGFREHRRPSLAYEQVLLMFDEKNELEHFIRSISFRAEDHPFGFVVPTPSKPTVVPLKTNPFPVLREIFPFDPPPPDPNSGFGKGHGRLGGGGVRVLEVSKVGSFTAFVLAANDAAALHKWLAENQLDTTTEIDAWLSHYVRLGFYYVAFRYDPSEALPNAKATPATELPYHSETVRISFKTPLAYYPYLEPLSSGSKSTERLLDLWLVSSAELIPVAAREMDGKTSWVRPMREGQVFDVDTERLARALAYRIDVLPPGNLVVQTFQDQKVSRAGIGDILFVPRAGELHASREKLEPLLGLLDPNLLPETTAALPP